MSLSARKEGTQLTTYFEEPSQRSRDRRGSAGLVAGGSGALAAWLIGALPWIVDGLRLPISSAWPTVDPEDVVRVALPFGENQLIGIFVATIVGGTVGVYIARLASQRKVPAWVGGLGAALGLGVALAQTLYAVQPLVVDGAEARLLTTALALLGVSGILLGLFAGLSLVHRSAWWSPLGVALLAAALTSWSIDLLNGRGVTTTSWQLWLNSHANWLVAVLLAAALLWTGWSPISRLVWWPLVVVALWVWPAVTAALFYVGVYARSGMGDGAGRAELIAATRDVFFQALLPNNHVQAPFVVGLVAAVIVAGIWQFIKGSQLSSGIPSPDD